MKIESWEYKDNGMVRVYENEKWMVGIKNWKPANDIEGIDCLERHNGTDELFVLLAGSCTLLFANEKNGDLEMEAEVMEPCKLYKIPQFLWHTTVTKKDTKLLLIEDSATSSNNSDVVMLNPDQVARVRKLVRS